MIISGTLQLDPVAHAAATASLADRLSDLEARRRAATSAVDGLLAAWRGDAASAFQEQWEVWSSASARVIGDLGAAVDTLPAAASDVVRADDRRAVAGDHLSGRLGGRLP
ncbi:WXG100 family type VII secretion target [Nocardioides sp. STR2]|uniref:WXG100 family type VII secretion target n=1 Tax=Nocardioides pini TaxID=2975053 RepID=A0ABT4CG77_9ACTN|nr:WXG100 family type VII secretion target [Nocardioides pini]MCY4726882.1 WXG100 family type VII secretion target [Nocardioides pini]